MGGRGPDIFIDIKASAGEVEMAVSAAQETIIDYYQSSEEELDYVTFTPVKYSYENYWRRNVILDRFAYSAGNSTGILESRLADPAITGLGKHESLFMVPSIERVLRDEYGAFDQSLVPATLLVWTLNLESTVSIQPQLPPALGIPINDVGVVIETNELPRTILVNSDTQFCRRIDSLFL